MHASTALLLARCVLAAGLMLILTGCGDGTVPVAGTASFNSEPIAKGEISFVSTDKATAPAGGVIENGKFAVRLKPGSRVVQIRGSRPLPAEQQPKDSGLLYEDYIPAKHHSESTLQVEIPANGKTDFNFDLKS